ncbi:hypothetical protein LI82_10120 [Methanococcoides methylutens]|uniref:Thymidylate kinase-like domain-containing protein n=1 Tax=Methanococcoides methylutens TaxID=2226 RepID=A0A099SYV5_METMT|nr:hypothetical protein [Methanococcoides methylutens]KGK98085.1 hypothetical protein LI82_10120 [Methanococcoides methylutens]
MNNQTCASESHFIVNVFNELEKQKLPYIVLRNYENLPQDAGHDIDVLVGEEDLDRYSTLLCETAKKEGWCLVQYAKRYGFHSFTFVSTLGTKEMISLKWDVWAPISWKGFTWIDTGVALKTRKAHQNGFYTPAPGVEAATLLLKEVLQLGKIKDKYLNLIKRYAQNDSDNFVNVLEKPFGKNTANRLLDYAQNGNWKQVEKAHKELRLILVKNAIKKSPISPLIGLYKFIKGHLTERIKGRPHIFLCLIGPDGSGKSTLSSEIIKSLEDIFEEKCYYHGHFAILPELKKFVPWMKTKENEIDVHGIVTKSQKPSRLITSILMTYYAIDYIIGYACIFQNRGKGNLILFDRYFYDYIIQPSKFGTNNILFRILSQIVPSPDLIIYPHAPSELIYNRKPELTIHEINRQENICNQLIKVLPAAHRVDNSLPLENVVFQIREIILEKMETYSTTNRR